MSKSLQGKWLHEVCSDFVKEYVFQSDRTLEIVNKTADLEQNIKSPFKCRKEECNKQYVSHSTRVRLVDELNYAWHNQNLPQFITYNC